MADHRKPGLLGRLRRLISGRASLATERQARALDHELAQWQAWLDRIKDDQQPSHNGRHRKLSP